MNLKELTKKVEGLCGDVKNDNVLTDYFLKNNPWCDRMWKEFDLWNGWFGLSLYKKPRFILEIGSAFGFSTIALMRGAGDNLRKMISIDLGDFGELMPNGKRADNLKYIMKGVELYKEKSGRDFIYRQYMENTQKRGQSKYGHWSKNVELTEDLRNTAFDLILIDGYHLDDGLYIDLGNFFKYGEPGCLIICDDLQCEDTRKNFDWFIKDHKSEIKESLVWEFLRSNDKYAGKFERTQGLIIKK